ncbi:MAG: hypothetical protein ABW075_08695 [Aeromicrobium sp.]
MKAFINVMLGIVVIALVAAVYLMIRTTGGADEEAPEAAEPDQVVYMSTGGVVDNIERRLESRIGSALTIRCPKKVDSAIGTAFRCSVRHDGGTEKIAIASVVIDGPDGEFTWTSSSDELRAPSPAPTPTA